MASTLPVFNDIQNYTGTLQYLTGVVSSGGYEVPGWYKVADEDALRALATSADNKAAVVDDLAGYGSAFFRWDTSSTEADDGVTIIAPTDGGPGRWTRVV
jgi:hypothetical protein